MMQEDDDDDKSQHNFNAISKKNQVNGVHQKTLVRFQRPKQEECNRKSCSGLLYSDSFSSSSKGGTVSRVALAQDVMSTSAFFVEDVIKQKKVRSELIGLFKDNLVEEEEREGRLKNQKRIKKENNPGLKLDGITSTKEFHLLTEVQKERILKAVEDTIKKLAKNDYRHFCNENPEECPRNHGLVSENTNFDKFLSKRFYLPCVLMKILEIVVCHIIQLTFLSNDLYFQKKKEFLPVVVTYYLILSIIIISLLVHVSCYAYTGFKHPCYFMCVVSSSILTLTTVLGILIMLCSMEYYKSFREILVIVFVGGLLATLAVELCICYVEVKNFWSNVPTTEQHYIC